MNCSYLFLIILASILSIAGILAAKLFVKTGEKHWWFIVLAVLLDIVIIFVYIILLKNHKMGSTYTVIKILSIIIITIIGYFFLKEKVTFKNCVGILFGIVALILLTN